MSWGRVVLIPLLILSGALGVTWSLWEHERQASHRELLSQFNFALGDAVGRVEQRMAAYEQMLRGVQGLYTATGKLEGGNLHDYVGALNLDANFSGMASTNSRACATVVAKRTSSSDASSRP